MVLKADLSIKSKQKSLLCPCLMVEVLLVDGVHLLILHVLLFKVRVGKVEKGAGAQHAADSPLVQLTGLTIDKNMYQ